MLSMLLITEFGGLSAQGIRPLYFVQFLGLMIIFLFTYKIFTEPKRSQSSRPPQTNFVADLQEVLKQGTMVKHWILYISIATIPMYLTTTFVPLYAAEMKNADQYIISGMTTATTIVPLLLSIPIGWLADRFGRKKVIYLGTPIYCLSFLLLIYAPDSTTLLLSGVFQGFFMLIAVTQGAMTAELVPTPLLGRWHGLLGLFRGLVSVIAPAIGGVIWEVLSPESVFIFLILTQFLRLFLLLPIPETLEKKAE